MGPLLLLDTCTDTMERWCQSLRHCGMHLLPVFAADEALDLLQTVDCSVLVTGHRAGLAADEVFAAARIYRPMIRGILCTESIDVVTAMRAAQLGFDDIVYMPFAVDDELERSVTASLRLADTWQSRLEDFDRPTSKIYWQSAGFRPNVEEDQASYAVG